MQSAKHKFAHCSWTSERATKLEMAENERRDDGDLTEELQSRRSSSSRRGLSYKCVKKMIIKVFSHVGLAATVVAYTIMGGFIFRALEAPNESKEKLRIVGLKHTMVNELHQLASHMCLMTIDKGNFTDSVQDMLLNFQQQVNYTRRASCDVCILFYVDLLLLLCFGLV